MMAAWRAVVARSEGGMSLLGKMKKPLKAIKKKVVGGETYGDKISKYRARVRECHELTRFALSVDQSTKRATWPARSAGLALNASKVSTSAASRSSVVWKNLLCVVRFLVSFHAPSVGL